MSTSSIHKYHPKNVSLKSQTESYCFGGRSRGLSLSFNEYRASSKKWYLIYSSHFDWGYKINNFHVPIGLFRIDMDQIESNRLSSTCFG